MDKTEKRAVIKYLHLKGLTQNEIAMDMKEVLGDNAPSQATVYRWVAEFQRGRQSTEDEHRSGRPIETCTNENIQCVQDLVQKDRRVNIRYVADCLKLSYGTTHHIITDILGYNKVCARWVPRMLTAENKQVRLTTSRENLDLFRSDQAKFLRRYVTWTRLGLTILIPRQNRRVWRGSTSIHPHQSNSAKLRQQAKLWHPYFGTVKVF